MVSRGDKTAADAARLFRVHPGHNLAVARSNARQELPSRKERQMKLPADGGIPISFPLESFSAMLEHPPPWMRSDLFNSLMLEWLKKGA